ncbi:MAG: hypothetical protein ABIA92_04030 [Patescibacteria group bacterium]
MSDDDENNGFEDMTNREILRIMLQEIADVRRELKEDIEGVRQELKVDIQSLQSDIKTIKSDVKNLQSDVKNLRAEVHQNHTSFIHNQEDMEKRIVSLEAVA